MSVRRILSTAAVLALGVAVAAPAASADGPAFSLDDGRGQVGADGSVSMSMTYACNELTDGGDTFLGVGLRQTRGPGTATAQGIVDGGFVCDGATHERTVVLLPEDGRVRRGPARVTTWVNACGFVPGCDQRTEEETVRLR